jgi:hypothetical protein
MSGNFDWVLVDRAGVALKKIWLVVSANGGVYFSPCFECAGYLLCGFQSKLKAAHNKAVQLGHFSATFELC